MELSEKLMNALDLEKQGNWDEAHGIVQVLEDPMAYLVHAYLHRKEGDLGNAAYWYNRAYRTMPEGSLVDEWSAIYEEVAKVTTKS